MPNQITKKPARALRRTKNASNAKEPPEETGVSAHFFLLREDEESTNILLQGHLFKSEPLRQSSMRVENPRPEETSLSAGLRSRLQCVRSPTWTSASRHCL